MIHIGKPYITTDETHAYLKARIDISEDTVNKYLEVTGKLHNCMWLTAVDYPPACWKGEEHGLWFSVEKEYKDYLCYERSNAFVVAMLWYAIATGSDIHFEVPVSQRLYDGITKTLMPALNEKGFKTIRLVGPLTSELIGTQGGVASGMSGGVDSNYTAKCYTGDNAPDGLKLTHLTFYIGNTLLPFIEGPYDVKEVFAERDRTYMNYYHGSKKCADYYGLPLIVVDNNMNTDFYRGGVVYSAMYRYFSNSIALEKLFKVYISSSSGHREHNLEPSLFAPTQNYEDILCESLQTESFKYITSDHVLRVEKIRAIADNKCFQDHAEVCFNQFEGEKNCGDCIGCWKTMIPLDFIGKLDRFENSFDVEKYYKNREDVFRNLIKYSFDPVVKSATDTVEQLIDLAHKEPSDAGDLFLKTYDEMRAADGLL